MKKHMIWIAELIIWGLLIFSAIFVSLYIYNKNIREKHTYYVFFHDIDGLIKGSPVKIQGYQIGYVSNISIVNDDVFITFVVTDKDIVMPENMAASVEFTGMGGSKSLELTPADSKSKKNIISVTQPKRVQDIYVNQTVIAQNLVLMSAGFMKMANDRAVNTLKAFIKNPRELSEFDTLIEDIDNQQNNLIRRVKKDGK